MWRNKLAVLLTLAAITLPAQTMINLTNQTKNVDFTNASFTRPVKMGNALPPLCTVGDMFLLVPAGGVGSLLGCMTANTWSPLGGGGQVASTEEAQSGTSDTKLMSPLKTAQAIAALGATLPSQSGNSGAILTTDGSTSRWTRHQTFAPAAAVISGAMQSIPVGRFYVQVSPDSNYTLANTPTIADGSDGQFLVITNVSTANTLTIQDEAMLAGSNLRLGGSNIALAPRQSLYLVFNGMLGDWVRADTGAPAAVATPAVQIVRYPGAKCQNTVAGSPFSLPTINAPTAVCDSGENTLFGTLQFTANGQYAQDSFMLPSTFSSLSAIITARTSSTSGSAGWTIDSACIGAGETMGSGGTGGPALSNSNSIVLAAGGSAYANTISAETALTVTGCAANELFLFKLSRNASTTAINPELVSLSFKVQ